MTKKKKDEKIKPGIKPGEQKPESDILDGMADVMRGKVRFFRANPGYKIGVDDYKHIAEAAQVHMASGESLSPNHSYTMACKVYWRLYQETREK